MGQERWPSRSPSEDHRRRWRATPRLGVVLALLFLVGLAVGVVSVSWQPVADGQKETVDEAARAFAQNPRRIEAVIDRKKATAVVQIFEDGKVAATFNGRSGSGAPGEETPSGYYRVTAHLGTIHTALYRATYGHEFILKYFLQFQGDYGFHAYKINDQTMRVEPDATHGCIAFSEADAKRLYDWATEGTPIRITGK